MGIPDVVAVLGALELVMLQRTPFERRAEGAIGAVVLWVMVDASHGDASLAMA